MNKFYMNGKLIIAMFNNELNTKAQLICTVHDITLLDCQKLFRKEQIWFAHKDMENAYYIFLHLSGCQVLLLLKTACHRSFFLSWLCCLHCPRQWLRGTFVSDEPSNCSV